MLGSVREGDQDAHGQATPTRPGTFGAYVVTDNVDAVYQRARPPGPRSSPSRTTPTTAPTISRRATRRGTAGPSGLTGASPGRA